MHGYTIWVLLFNVTSVLHVFDKQTSKQINKTSISHSQKIRYYCIFCGESDLKKMSLRLLKYFPKLPVHKRTVYV